MASLELPFGVKPTNPTPVDAYYGPYVSVAGALAGVPRAVRYDGQTVQVTGLGEYHWLAADLSDAGLVPKSSGGGGTYTAGPGIAITSGEIRTEGGGLMPYWEPNKAMRAGQQFRNSAGVEAYSLGDITNTGTLEPFLSTSSAGTNALYKKIGLVFTDEQMRDITGALIQDSSTIDATYNKAAASLALEVKADSIDEARLSPGVRTKLNTDNTYTDAQADARVLVGLNLLRDGVSAEGDTLKKLFNLILGATAEVTVATLAARNAYNVPRLPFNIFVTDNGDGRWALYKATTTGAGATFVLLSDPDLLNAALSASQIKTAYESNPDTNAFTNALLTKLNGLSNTVLVNALTETVAGKALDATQGRALKVLIDALTTRVTATETAIGQLQTTVTGLNGEVDAIQALIPAGAGPTDLLVKQSQLPAAGSGTISVSGITEFRDRFSDTFTGTPQEFATALLVVYQAPAFTSFTVDSAGSRTVEVGTGYAAGAHTFQWGTSNAGNITANSLTIRDVTAAQNVATALVNDGTESVTLAGFTVNNGLSRTYRISGTTTKGVAFTRDLTITGSYALFYGPTSGVPAGSAQVRALGSNQLASAGNSFVLNTGSTQRYFALWLPTGKTLLSVTDLDALNADITSQYVGQALNVNDAAGNAVAGTLYTMTQAVPYSSSHRHQIATT